MRTSENFIQNITGKKRWIYERDDSWINNEQQIVSLRKRQYETRRIEERPLKAEKYHALQLMFEEVANNIYDDSTLSQSYGNPEWYPPVPEYTPPIGRKVSVDEMCAIRFRKAQETINSNPIKEAPIPVTYQNFWDAWVYTSESAITREEWEAYNESLNPYLSWRVFTSEIRTMEVLEWGDTKNERNSMKTVERIKWAVNFCTTKDWEELLGISCYREKEAIEELTGFLADTRVANNADKMEAILSLSFIHWELEDGGK